MSVSLDDRWASDRRPRASVGRPPHVSTIFRRIFVTRSFGAIGYLGLPAALSCAGTGGRLRMANGDQAEAPGIMALTPAIGWLLREGAFAPGPAALLAGLAERLVAEGLPLAEATLSVASLDPLLAGSDFQWRRETGRVVEAPRFHGAAALMPAEAVAGLALDVAGTGHRLTLAPTDGAAFDQV